MKGKMKELSLKEKQYLEERGFKIIKGSPSPNEHFPYITLREPQEWELNSEITYHASPRLTGVTYSVYHPSNRKESDLIKTIERMTAEGMTLEGKIIHTKPGKPIKVFVMDNAWMSVAKKLAEKYEKR